MSGRLLSLYHALPPQARSCAASLRGFYLRWWRYGPVTERLAREALERETWSAAQWQSWREQRLAYILHRAATCVPYYREQWAERRRQGDPRSWEDLENWPILEKETVRQNPRRFVAEDCRLRAMYHERTSGTTGTPLVLWASRDTLRRRYALYEARRRLWHGVSRHDRWGMLGGQLVAPAAQRRPPFWVWNAGLNQLYMSSYHLAPDLLPYYLDALKTYRVSNLVGYSSALTCLAQAALREQRTDLQMQVVVTNAEPLLEHQRQIIREAFHCPVRETYGLAELVMAASECAAGTLHLWPCFGHVEVMERDRPVPPGTVGEFICTSLLNPDMLFIRYRIGDRGALADDSATCACGRTLPIVQSIEGRNDDVLHTPDGRRVGRLDPVFKADMSIREAQIIQEQLDALRVRYVPGEHFRPADAQRLVEQLRERVGPMAITLEPVPHIERTPHGKFRSVVCRLPDELRKQLDACAGGDVGGAATRNS